MKRIFFLIASIGLLSGACSKQSFYLPPANESYAQTVTYNNKVDIILVVDNSSSMSQYQNRLADQTGSMIDTLNALGMNYHIAVVTTDMQPGGSGGQFIGSPKYLTGSSPNLVSTLQDKIRAGNSGSANERGVSSILSSLSPSYLAGQGAGFLRSEAYLAIVVLSDENDNSVESNAQFMTFLDKLKPATKTGQRNWVLNLLGTLNLDSFCKSLVGSIVPGTRWIDLAEASGGIQGSICQNTFAETVGNIGTRIIAMLTDFYLMDPPIESSIVVRINGVLIPRDTVNGWDYIPSLQVVRFYGSAVPRATDGLSIDYQPAGAR